jgi:hypothetical protein
MSLVITQDHCLSSKIDTILDTISMLVFFCVADWIG